MSKEIFPFSSILAYLQELCREKCTGTLLITNNYQLSGQISIQSGEIVFLFSQGKRGPEALPLLASTQQGAITFSENKVPLKTPLPDTAEILEYLSAANSATSANNGDPPSIRPREPSSIRPREPSSIRPLSTSAKTTLEQTLKEFIGPIAKLVCADHFRTATTLDAAIDALASEVPSSETARQFRELAHKRLS